MPSTKIEGLVITKANSPSGIDMAEVSGLKACGSSAAWYLDKAAKPQAITLCPLTCAAARADGASKVEVNAECRP